jgi:hypothetical protein
MANEDTHTIKKQTGLMVKKRKRVGSGSRKGGIFERLVSKQLSLWWSDGEDDNIFWRTAASGGRATVRSKKGKRTINNYGDIKADNPIGQPFLDCFTPELKVGYPGVAIQDLFHHVQCTPGKNTDCWYNWIKQAKRSSKASGSLSWCLIVKKQKKSALIVMPTCMFHACLTMERRCELDCLMEFRIGPLKLSVCDFGEFLDYVLPKDIIRLAKDRETYD